MLSNLTCCLRHVCFLFALPYFVYSNQCAAQSFSLSIDSDVEPDPVTGRAYLFIARTNTTEPRLQASTDRSSEEFLGLDVDRLAPGKPVIFNGSTEGFPLASLRQLPAGDYFVQAAIVPYTEFHRADGHTIWAHMDAGEGQRFNDSPGSLVSAVQKIHFDPHLKSLTRLTLNRKLPELPPVADTVWVKRLHIESALVSKFWNHRMTLGAVVLLPKGYDDQPDKRYPVVYSVGHFSERAPFGFTVERCDKTEAAALREARLSRSARETGCEFQQGWTAGQVPGMIAVFIQHPTPFYDDSYVLNSANNGPYGDALTTELIPEIDHRFRTINAPYARVLTGGSTGGWDVLALQIHYPAVFGGAWSLYPDSLDFHTYQMGDLYRDSNAYERPDNSWLASEVPSKRNVNGTIELSVREENQAERVIASKGRSGGQWDGWQAAWAPVGNDGYPQPVWDKRTGLIDLAVVESMRANGYDLRDYLERNWTTLGPQLAGKLHIAVGDADNYFLNLGVYRFDAFLESTRLPEKGPYYAGTVEYGRPLKPHGWQPWSNQELLQRMMQQITQNAPGNDLH